MKSDIIIIAAQHYTRKRLSRYFEDRGFRCRIVERARVVPEQQIVITQDTVKFCGEDLLQNTAAAIVLDSGYMWPQPTAIPSEEQWFRYEENLDEYLRNERESASFWYSFLEILNDRLPVCVNPQEAYATEAFKPWALDLLSEQGIGTAAFIAGNNKKRIEQFLVDNPGPVLSLPVSNAEASSWVSRKELADLDRPVFLQAFSSKQGVRVLAVNGKAIHIEPQTSEIEEIADLIPPIQSVLKIHLSELVFRRSDKLVLSDFTAAPDLNRYPDDILCRALDELVTLIETATI